MPVLNPGSLNSAGAPAEIAQAAQNPPNPRGYNMYGWIFRHLPGTSMGSHYHCYSAYRRDRYALMEFVFPNFAEYGPFNFDVTINH